MGKFVTGVLLGFPAGAFLLGAGLVSIWKDGRWVEWAETTDRNLSVRLGLPRQMGSSPTRERELTVSDILGGISDRY